MKNNITRAGMQLCLSGIFVFLGIQLAEINYVGKYSTKSNYISDLGINNSFAAAVFNISMMTAGILIYIANRKFSKNNFSNWMTIPLRLYGIGTFMVGLFPSTIGPLHGFGATLIFFLGPPAAFASRKYLKGGFKILAITLAGISTLFLISFLMITSTNNGIEGIGGTERFLIYPITMWLIVFGANIANKS